MSGLKRMITKLTKQSLTDTYTDTDGRFSQHFTKYPVTKIKMELTTTDSKINISTITYTYTPP